MEAIPGPEAEARAFLEEVALRLREDPGMAGYAALDLGGGRIGVFISFRDDEALEQHAHGVRHWIEQRRPELFVAPYAVTRGAPVAIRS